MSLRSSLSSEMTGLFGKLLLPLSFFSFSLWWQQLFFGLIFKAKPAISLDRSKAEVCAYSSSFGIGEFSNNLPIENYFALFIAKKDYLLTIFGFLLLTLQANFLIVNIFILSRWCLSFFSAFLRRCSESRLELLLWEHELLEELCSCEEWDPWLSWLFSTIHAWDGLNTTFCFSLNSLYISLISSWLQIFYREDFFTWDIYAKFFWDYYSGDSKLAERYFAMAS